MIKKIFICLLFVIAVPISSAWAAGIGAYGTGGVAFTTWYYDGTKGGTTQDYFYGGGLIVDSNAARNTLFNYRFTAGYERFVVTDPDLDYEGDPIHRVSMTHTFGFGIARSEAVRFWIGPRIGLHYLFLNKSYTEWEFSPFLGMLPQKVKIDLDALGVDVLLALGLNFNIGQTVTLFIDLGFGYMGNYNLNNTQEMGHAFGLDGKAGIMFRINDTYAAVN
ncbi:MAG: hypothetical protein JXA07_11095 [Spirochaetes bacterium]|nr:hypothetical protein [Spirochaetota bacterium]